MNLLNNTDIIRNTMTFFDNGSVSRKDLSEFLGISISSAGIIISKLISLGIVHEYTHSSKTPGRNSRSVTLNHEPVFAICQISHDSISASFFGFDLSIRKTYNKVIDDPIFIDDALSSFLRELRKLKKPLKSICFVSNGLIKDYGVVGSGIPGLDSIPLFDMMHEYLPDTIPSVENKAYWSLTNRSGINVIYDEINGFSKITVIHDGKIIGGRSGLAGHIGEMRGYNDRTLTFRIKYAENKNDYVAALSDLIYSVILLLDPHRIYINTDRYSAVDMIIKYITEKLITEYKLNISDLPLIFSKCENFDLSLPSLRLKMRNDYVFSRFLTSEK